MTEQQKRAAVIVEAKSWLGTPYMSGQRMKGIGCDCGTFLLEVFLRCGLIPYEDQGIYARDWHLHAKADWYYYRVFKHASKIAESRFARELTMAKPGDLVLSKAGHAKVYSHGAIVLRWPLVIHAMVPRVCVVPVTHKYFSGEEKVIFNPFVAPEEAAIVR